MSSIIPDASALGRTLYDAGGIGKNAYKSWVPPTHIDTSKGDSTEWNLIKDRAWDLYRNSSAANSIVNSLEDGVVSTGIRVFPRPNRKILGITEDEADEWSDRVKFLFDEWAKSNYSDATGQNNFYTIQRIMLINSIISGDSFAALKQFEPQFNFSGLRILGIDASRVETPADKRGDPYITHGIEVSKTGTPLYVYVRKFKGVNTALSHLSQDYHKIRIYGKYKKQMYHVYQPKKWHQYRTVSELAPVMEGLKQITRFSEAEVTGAVLSSYYTAFITSESGTTGMGGSNMPVNGVDNSGDNDYKLGPGAIQALKPGQGVKFAEHQRPNSRFETFYDTMIKNASSALGLPKDVVQKEFQKSYTAARASFLQVERENEKRASILNMQFNAPVYKAFLTEQVIKGNIEADGFFEDPIRKAAWCNALWIRKKLGTLNPKDEVQARKQEVDEGFKTRTEVTLEHTGSDYTENIKQLSKEKRERERLDINVPMDKDFIEEPEEEPENTNGEQDEA